MASAEQTISWSWWNSIRGSTIAPIAAAGNNTRAMAMPEARLFFEPQKTAVISSSFENPRARLPNVVTTRTTASSTRQSAPSTRSEVGDVFFQRPSVTDALNAPYTTRRMLPRSVSSPRIESADPSW